MFFVALATDYDGTIARHGRIEPAAIDALNEVRTLSSGDTRRRQRAARRFSSA